MIIRRVSISILVALLIAVVINFVAYAATYTISETSNKFKKMWGETAQTETCASCADGSAKYLRQYNWDDHTYYIWDAGYSNIKHWCAYIPGVGVAGVRYAFENDQEEYYDVVLNQASNKQRYRYLGYFETFPNSGGILGLTNACVSGYSCDGRRVYWDKIKLTTGSGSTHNCSP